MDHTIQKVTRTENGFNMFVHHFAWGQPCLLKHVKHGFENNETYILAYVPLQNVEVILVPLSRAIDF